MLNVLKNDKKKYINFINFILYTEYKNVYKHYSHYNYFYSVSLLHLINDILFFQLNFSDTDCNIEEKISEKLCTIINNNYYYIQRDKFTWNYIQKHYDVEFYNHNVYNNKDSNNANNRNGNNYKNLQNLFFYNNMDLINDVNFFRNYSMNNLKLNKKSAHLEKPIIHEEYNNKDVQKHDFNNAYNIIKAVNSEYNIISENIDCSYLIKYIIILLTMVVKKIRYIENRTAIMDVENILESINLLMHIDSKFINLNNLINEKDIFLKNIISFKYNESLYFLLFLNFIFNILKNLRYANNYFKITKIYDKNENFFKVLSITSNIRYLLTINNKININKNYDETHKGCENNLIEVEQNKRNLIKKINKNICLLNNEIILTYSNYMKLSNESPVSCKYSLFNYISYTFNDLYLQNNYQIKKIVFSYFLKHYKNFNSILVPDRTGIYLQYITIYNFLKLFKNDINKSSGEYYNVLKIFMECFDNNIYQKLSEDNFMNNIQEDHKIKYYLHFLNRLCYFFYLSKKFITNCEFLVHINCHFYLTFYLINQYIEKNMNCSELFTYFVNKCINKITIILIIHKYFNMLGEDLIQHLLKFLHFTYNIISSEKKRKILIYIFPFIKEEKHILDNLKNFLIDKEINQYNTEKKIEDSSIEKSTNYNIVKEENFYLCTNVKSNPNDDKNNDLNNKTFNYLKEKENENELFGNMKINNAEVIENFEKNNGSQLKNNELYLLLDKHIKENCLIKKENKILKNKINYIVLNFENFISSYINVLESKNRIFLYEKEFIKVKNKKDCTLTKKNSKIYNTYNNEIHKIKDVSNLCIKFDYQHVDVEKEYFYKLKKYENKNCIKINNILINMYMYNPYICVKNKNIFLAKDKKHKKMIILPYDAYKNIQKLVNYDINRELNLFKKLKCLIYLFFYKLKTHLSKKM